MSTTPAAKDDTAIRELVPTKVRFVVQSRRPQKQQQGAKPVDTSYSQLKGHTRIVEVRTLREFRRLWKAVEQAIDGGAWRDVRRTTDPGELPAAGTPVAGRRS